MNPESLYALEFASDPQLSSDGRHVAFVVTRTEDDKPGAENAKKVYRSRIWLAKGREAAQPFTRGVDRDSNPRFSPDGSQLAFTSSRYNAGKPEPAQLFVMPVHGGEARALTRFKTSVTQPRWSPDGQHLAFVSRGDAEDKRAEEGTPRAFERIQYKENGRSGPGFRPDEPASLWLVNLEGQAEQVFTPATEITAFDWLPDGSGIVFNAAKDVDQQAKWGAELFLLNLKSRKAVPLTDFDGFIGAVDVSPDGRHVACLASFEYSRRPSDLHVHVLKLEDAVKKGRKRGKLERLDARFDQYANNAVNSDAHIGDYPMGPVWTSNESLVMLYTLGGSGTICTMNLEGEVKTVPMPKHSNVAALATNPSGTLAYLLESNFALMDMYRRDGTRVSKLSSLNPAFKPASLDLEHLKLRRDGFTVEGWLLKPANWRSGKKYPVLLEIHGGPATAYGHGFMHEFQLLASRGFAVLFANIRGSVGYGDAQTAGTNGRYGAGDFDDLMAFFDAALERFPWLDAKRAGVIGGSYGGVMTNWTISHTNRFKAAVTDRSICNWVSFYGTSDIGYRFTPRELCGHVPEDLEHLWENSPLKHVQNVTTPCLVIHSEEDHRCPIEQAEQWFVALKRQGVETRFVRFPSENHELSRSGRPDRRVVRLTEIVNWFERFLK